METILRFAKAKGFYSRVANNYDLLDTCLPEQSVRQCGWCTVVGVGTRTVVDVGTRTIHTSSHSSQIAVFLLWLRRVSKLSVLAVMGNRSMLSCVFGFKLPEILLHQFCKISDLLR